MMQFIITRRSLEYSGDSDKKPCEGAKQIRLTSLRGRKLKKQYKGRLGYFQKSHEKAWIMEFKNIKELIRFCMEQGPIRFFEGASKEITLGMEIVDIDQIGDGYNI